MSNLPLRAGAPRVCRATPAPRLRRELRELEVRLGRRYLISEVSLYGFRFRGSVYTQSRIPVHQGLERSGCS